MRRDEERQRWNEEMEQLLARRTPEDEARENRIDDFMNTMDIYRCEDIYRNGKTKPPEGLRAKCEKILACPYEDLKQTLEDILYVLIALWWERDEGRERVRPDRLHKLVDQILACADDDLKRDVVNTLAAYCAIANRQQDDPAG